MNIDLRRAALACIAAAAALALHGCGKSSQSPRTGSVHLALSDASTDNWATIGVRVQEVALIPQGGGSPVTIYTAPNPPPYVNLTQLDEMSDLLADAEVPVGTYTGAIVTIGANTGDVRLVVSADPEPGFPLDPGTLVPPGQIVIRGATGENGHMTVTVDLRLQSPLVVTEGQSEPLDLEFDLAHPLFIVEHDPAEGAPVFVVSFSGPLRHRPFPDIAQLLLRHLYGSVASVSADLGSIAVTRYLPPVPPDTEPVATSQTLDILADAVNGTIFYDLDANAAAVIDDFGALADSLPGKYVRVAARYQQNGTLVAVRIWASATLAKVLVSPEGHVLHVDEADHVLTILGENGTGIPLTIDASTEFLFRTPMDASSDPPPIGTGPNFLQNLKRGFKVHASVVDPLATPLVADVVDIEIAKYEGAISAADVTGFHYTQTFANPADDYEVSPTYIASTSPNGVDASGAIIRGYKWWNFAFPTLADTGAGAIADFVAATGGSADFGGAVGPVVARGMSMLRWDDPAANDAWSASWTVLVPSRLPPGSVATSWVPGTGGGSFGMVADGNTGGNVVPVKVSTVSGSATLVFRVDLTISGTVDIRPQDITDPSVLASVSAALASGTKVRVFGIPDPTGSIKAYVLFYSPPIVP